MLSSNREHPQPMQDKRIRGRLLTFSINSGLKKLTNRFKTPAAKLAHSAEVLLKPIASKIETE